jgi:hypothetical protein
MVAAVSRETYPCAVCGQRRLNYPDCECGTCMFERLRRQRLERAARQPDRYEPDDAADKGTYCGRGNEVPY